MWTHASFSSWFTSLWTSWVSISSCIKMGEKYQHGWGAVLYKMGEVTVLYRNPQPKTQPQHSTTNMSRCRPTRQQLWSHLSMATSAMALDLGAAVPYGSVAGVGLPVRSYHYRLHWLDAIDNKTEAPMDGCWGVVEKRWVKIWLHWREPSRSGKMLLALCVRIARIRAVVLNS